MIEGRKKRNLFIKINIEENRFNLGVENVIFIFVIYLIKELII